MADDSDKPTDLDQPVLVGEPRRRFSKVTIGGLLGLGVAALAAAPFYFQGGGSPEESGPQAGQDFTNPDLGRVDVTPAVAAPPSSAQPIEASREADEENARRIAELEARLRDQEARLAEAEHLPVQGRSDDPERFNSPLIVVETVVEPAQQPPSDTAAGGAPAAEKPSEGALQAKDSNEQFLASRSELGVDVAKASQTKRIDALVPQGTMLRGVLETSVNTDLPGMVRALTTEDVWSFDGRRILIPSGSRLIGEYNSEIKEGQTRAFIAWTRLLRADGVSLNLGSIGTDELGRSGMTGRVNTHFLKRFGSAILISTLSALPAVMQETGSLARPRYSGPTTTTRYEPVGCTPGTADCTAVTTTTYPDDHGGGSSNIALGAAAAVSRGLGESAQEFLKKAMAIQPTITINQGAAIAIFVRRDLDFSELYPDPVMERFRELVRRRR